MIPGCLISTLLAPVIGGTIYNGGGPLGTDGVGSYAWIQPTASNVTLSNTDMRASIFGIANWRTVKCAKPRNSGKYVFQMDSNYAGGAGSEAHGICHSQFDNNTVGPGDILLGDPLRGASFGVRSLEIGGGTLALNGGGLFTMNGAVPPTHVGASKIAVDFSTGMAWYGIGGYVGNLWWNHTTQAYDLPNAAVEAGAYPLLTFTAGTMLRPAASIKTIAAAKRMDIGNYYSDPALVITLPTGYSAW